MCYTGVRPGELVEARRKNPKDGSVDELFGERVVMQDDSDNGLDEAVDETSRKLSQLLLREENTMRGRPKALCYEDIHMMIVRHPQTGQPIPAMAIKFTNHKGADNKPKPTIFFFTPAKKLIFCVILVILAIALHDNAFVASSLTNASRVFETKVWGPGNYIALRWKEEKLKVPVFRQIQGTTLSLNEAMPYSKLNYDMGRQSLDSGFEKAWTPRFARRGAGNAANGDASDAVRDQMMRHDPKFLTFSSAYLNEIANFDLQNAFLEEEKQDQLFRLFAHVTLTRDPRATRDMVPAEVWANTPPDPEIVALEEQRAALKQGHYRIAGCEDEKNIRQLSQTIRVKKAERERRIVKEYREFYFRNHSTWVIEAQARGEMEEEYKEPEINLAIPERARLAEILCHQPDDWTSEEIHRHRIESVDLMVALCDKKETGKRSRTQLRTQIGQDVKQESPTPEVIFMPEAKPDIFPLLMEATQCPDCIGDEQLPPMERTFRWCRTTVRNDHFDDQHLPERERAEQRGEAITCNHPKCKGIKLKHLDHLRAHTLKPSIAI
ncbi:domain containing [Trichoderma arundinaceum]|uniref:Domain containing n=1 Tax=Trichoderma arundinaceum TaxID=490622 RepID=A0A395N8Q1_TRIAR|nr:domain containing [Trichoderma arundinaceum]